MQRVTLLLLAVAAAACGSDDKASAGDAVPGGGGRSWLVEVVATSPEYAGGRFEFADVRFDGEAPALALPPLHAIRTRVLDGDGMPVAAHVSFTRESRIPGRPAHVVDATDDGSGFTVLLSADRYLARVTTKDAPARPPREFPVEVASKRDIDLRFPPATSILTVSGTIAQVVDAANRIPIPSLSARVVSRTTGRLESTTTVSGEDGSFRLQLWGAPGVFDLILEPNAAAPGFPVLRTTFEVTDRQVADRALELGVIAMPVYEAPRTYTFAVRGTADNGADVPVAGAIVRLETPILSPLNEVTDDTLDLVATFLDEAQVDEDGFVRLQLVPPEAGKPSRQYRLNIEAPAGSDFASVRLDAFVLETPSRVTELRLMPKVRLSGYVFAADETPVENAKVEVARSQDGTLALGGSRQGPMAVTTTDATGKYVLRVDYGRYDVTAAPPPGSPHPRVLREGLLVESDYELPLALAPGAPASGWLEDPAGMPIAGAEVRIYEVPAGSAAVARLRAQAQTDGSGAFRVVLPE